MLAMMENKHTASAVATTFATNNLPSLVAGSRADKRGDCSQNNQRPLKEFEITTQIMTVLATSEVFDQTGGAEDEATKTKKHYKNSLTSATLPPPQQQQQQQQQQEHTLNSFLESGQNQFPNSKFTASTNAQLRERYRELILSKTSSRSSSHSLPKISQRKPLRGGKDVFLSQLNQLNKDDPNNLSSKSLQSVKSYSDRIMERSCSTNRKSLVTLASGQSSGTVQRQSRPDIDMLIETERRKYNKKHGQFAHAERLPSKNAVWNNDSDQPTLLQSKSGMYARKCSSMPCMLGKNNSGTKLHSLYKKKCLSVVLQAKSSTSMMAQLQRRMQSSSFRNSPVALSSMCDSCETKP